VTSEPDSGFWYFYLDCPWHFRQFSLKSIVSFLGLFWASIAPESITTMNNANGIDTGNFMEIRGKKDIIFLKLVEQLTFYAKKKKRVF
jgi:hypothetical protein